MTVVCVCCRAAEDDSDRERRDSFQREGQEDPQTAHHLLQPAAAGAKPPLPADTVPRPAGARRAGRLAGTHADAGKRSRKRTRRRNGGGLAGFISTVLHAIVKKKKRKMKKIGEESWKRCLIILGGGANRVRVCRAWGSRGGGGAATNFLSILCNMPKFIVRKITQQHNLQNLKSEPPTSTPPHPTPTLFSSLMVHTPPSPTPTPILTLCCCCR